MTGKVLGVVIATLVLVGPANGQNPTDSGYGGQGGGVQTTVDSGSSLPFTGLDILLLVGSGILLLAAGFALRRTKRA